MRTAMAKKTVRDRLEDTLEELAEYDLKKFKLALSSLPVKEGYDNIPRGRLLKGDVSDVSHLLLSYYTEDYAVQVTVTVLNSIAQKYLVKKFLQVVETGHLDGCFANGPWQHENRNRNGSRSSLSSCKWSPFERDLASLRSLRLKGLTSFSLALSTSFDLHEMRFKYESTSAKIINGRIVTRKKVDGNVQETVEFEDDDQSNPLAINGPSAVITETEAIANLRKLSKNVTDVIAGEVSRLLEGKEDQVGEISSGRATKRTTMVKKTIYDLLVDALEELNEYDLRKFKFNLNSLPIKEGYDNIPRGRLEKADVLDLSHLLLSFYTEDYAMQVTITVLNSIAQKHLVKKLLQVVETGHLDGCFGHGQWQHGNGDRSRSSVALYGFPPFKRDCTSLRSLRCEGLQKFFFTLFASLDLHGIESFKCVSISVDGTNRTTIRVVENGQERVEVQDNDQLNPLAIYGASPIMREPEAVANFQILRNKINQVLLGEVLPVEEVKEDMEREISSGRATKRPALCIRQNGETSLVAHVPSKRMAGPEIFYEQIPLNCLEDLECISQGGFGIISRARHKEKGIVALKTLHRTDESYIREQILNEARIMDEACFAYIPRLYGICVDREAVGMGTPRLVMEYMENGDLSTFQSSVPSLPWALRIRILHQVALGMDFLHSLCPQVLHLDLKPQNVLLDGDLNAKVADFGLSKFRRGTTQHSLLSCEEGEGFGGTLQYMPPEAFTNSYEPGPSTDVYSYGILMFSVLADKEPYPNISKKCSSIFRMHILEEQRPNTTELEAKILQVERLTDLIRLMKWCWHDDKAQRPSFKVCSQETEDIYSCYRPHIETTVREVQDILNSSSSEKNRSSLGSSLKEASLLSVKPDDFHPQSLPTSSLRESPSRQNTKPPSLSVTQDQAELQSTRRRPWSVVDAVMPHSRETKEDPGRGVSSGTATKGSIGLESMASCEKPSDLVKKSKRKLTESLALQKHREEFLNTAKKYGFLTKCECYSLSQVNDPQEFVESLADIVLGKTELMHQVFLQCLKDQKVV
ncbi:uncharacterized protein LOC133365897 isoform X2 [Rhineura floridana]|uniref:uncharacterized protein LOC133365897 isoform X2 n=1 Tax=Rhineura floridana TaxID=261503 RepID=UPI002AC861C3|nr:uncharacterized protein LOC133365897 isoform X2 [Rhineura floridana]